jgi:hypothetical protein
MAHVVRYLPAYGAAVYQVTDATAPDDAPLSAPLSNLSRVKFHSDLTYPSIVDTRTVTVTVPGASPGADVSGTLLLFSHGRTGTPLVFGHINSFRGIAKIPLSGSVPLLYSGTGNWTPSNGGMVMVDLYSTTSEVRLGYFGNVGFQAAAAFPSFDLNITAYVCDATAEAPDFSADATAPMLELTADRVTAGRRKFDTNKKYLRQTSAASATFPLPKGRTMQTSGTPSSATWSPPIGVTGWNMRYQLAGYTMNMNGISSFTGTYTNVTL